MTDSASIPKITVVGNPVLAAKTRPVTEFDVALSELIDGMFAAMRVANGVGLAGPQVGSDLAVFVYDCPDENGVQNVGHVCNPTIETSGAKVLHEEGCLSVPGPYADLERFEQATVTGVDKTGAPVTVTGTGFLARCLQHETDHLDGVLYIDHLPRNRRRRVLRDMEPFEWNEQN